MFKNKSTRQRGHDAETIALKYLTQQGLVCLERNFHSRYGEIDLIMQDENIIVFTEVRLRQTLTYGGPLESVDYRKQQKIIKTAQYYLYRKKWTNLYSSRFDVLAIKRISGTIDDIIWVPNAFEIID